MMNSLTKEKNIHNLYVGPKDPQTTLRHGGGEYIFSNTYFRYAGNYENGKKHGNGCLMLGNGTTIEGIFNNDELTGQAIMRYANGDIFQGDLVLGEKTGYGEFDGMWCSYKGMWDSNKRQGEGELIDKTDGVTIVGNFDKHKPHGHCVINYPKANMCYEGNMHYGVKSGTGLLDTEKEKYTGEWKDNKYHGTGELSNKINGMDYKGEFVQGEPSIFANEIVVKVYHMATVVDEQENENIERVDLAQTHEDINLIFDKTKICIEVFVVYQGPEYPDPNPPPVEEKKAAKGKAKGKNEPEEVEIPMLKPDPIFITGESGRRLKFDQIRITEPVEVKKAEDAPEEPEQIQILRLDYRDDLEAGRKNIEIRKKIEEDPHMKEDEIEMMQAQSTPKHKNPPKKGAKSPEQKKPLVPTAKDKSTSQGSNLEIPGIVGKVVSENKKSLLMAKRLSFANMGPVTLSLYKEEEIPTHELETICYTEDEGKAELVDLEIPDNHPEGKFFIRIVDDTEFLARDALPEYRIPISIGEEVEVKGKGKAKPKAK